MADISKIKLPSGTTYDIKDAAARQKIRHFEDTYAKVMNFLGVTTTSLTDGSSTNPITIGGTSVTAGIGDIAIYGTKEFVFSTDNKWHELGEASRTSGSTKYTPEGTVSKPTFSGTQATITSTYTPSGNVTISKDTGTANYTPQGSISIPTITITPGETTVNSITAVGTLPQFTTTVTSETLEFSWDAGSLPTKGSDQKVLNKNTTASSNQPTFTGSGAYLKATFEGTQGNATATYKPAGTVSQPTFTGEEATISITLT